MEQQNPVIFREVQRPRQIWVWLLILGNAGLLWYGFIQQIIYGIPVGDKPAPNGVMVILWLLFGIGFPVLFLGVMKLIIEIREDGLYVRFVPFHIHYKQYKYTDLDKYEKIKYSPIRRFGGWGIRLNIEGEIAYNMSGNYGIELKSGNETIVIGTNHPDELMKALDSIREKTR